MKGGWVGVRGGRKDAKTRLSEVSSDRGSGNGEGEIGREGVSGEGGNDGRRGRERERDGWWEGGRKGGREGGEVGVTEGGMGSSYFQINVC